jgi:hypothetical protein
MSHFLSAPACAFDASTLRVAIPRWAPNAQGSSERWHGDRGLLVNLGLGFPPGAVEERSYVLNAGTSEIIWRNSNQNVRGGFDPYDRQKAFLGSTNLQIFAKRHGRIPANRMNACVMSICSRRGAMIRRYLQGQVE